MSFCRLAALGLLLVGLAPAKAAIPFVGCASDGQLGPVAGPRRGAAISVPRAAEGRLAYYASDALGVVAPRGWHCFGLYGSNGAILIVTPEPHGAADFLDRNVPLRGPAIQISLSNGGTSGRFAVADLIARLFPAYMSFARRAAAEDAGYSLPAGPYRSDTLHRRSASEVGYTTPARREGLGTHTRLAANGVPIHGLVILHPVDDWDAIELAVRLPRGQAGLAPLIVDATIALMADGDESREKGLTIPFIPRSAALGETLSIGTAFFVRMSNRWSFVSCSNH